MGEVAEHELCVAEAKKGSEPIWDEEGFYAECVTIADFGKFLTSYQEGVTTVPKCSALPAGLLESKYSMEMWSGVEKKERIYETLGEGPRVESQGMTDKTSRFRASIEYICEACTLQAPNEEAKASLLGKCKAIQSSALTEDDTVSHNALSVSTVALASLFISGFTFVLFRLGR